MHQSVGVEFENSSSPIKSHKFGIRTVKPFQLSYLFLCNSDIDRLLDSC